MGKVDVKKLKKALTLSHYDTILRELGIPIFSKSNTEWRCWSGEKNRNPMDGSPALVFFLILRYSQVTLVQEVTTALVQSKPA